MSDYTEMENYFLFKAAYWVAKQGLCPAFHSDPMFIPNLIKEKIVVPGNQAKTFWNLTEKGRSQAQATAAIFGEDQLKELMNQAATKAVNEQNQDGRPEQ